MPGSIFRKTRDFFGDCAQTEDTQSHSLQLTPEEFVAFKAIFITTAMEHSASATHHKRLKFDIAPVIKGSANDFVLDGEGILARFTYNPETQTMTLSGDKLPWKSLATQLKAINAHMLDNGQPATRPHVCGGPPEEIVLNLCLDDKTVVAYNAIYRSIAKEMGLDDTRIEASPDPSNTVPLPFLCMPRDMYDTLRAAELLPGNSIESLRSSKRGG